MENQRQSSSDVDEPADRATGLGRLLVYALADAKELGSDTVITAISAAVTRVQVEFRLTDGDILRR